MNARTLAVTALWLLAIPSLAGAASEPPATGAARGPLPKGAVAISSHAPFEDGDCTICHERNDPKQPGALIKPSRDLCLGCHEEFVDVMKRPSLHAPAKRACVNCHNAHNSTQRKLLVDAPLALCSGCHEEVRQVADQAKVPHQAVTTGKVCLNCHNPHGSSVKPLLIQLPFDLCLGCHDKGDLKDPAGKPLQNVRQWLSANRVWHGPVAKKDCSACHLPHGGDNFRLLKKVYPQEFYAPYSPAAYALCFSCHEEPAFSTQHTTTLTSFRNGDVNLHYVHLQQNGRGRTCRACHEIHASSQDHHIRDGVPYGSSGWILKLHYRKTDTGGSCEKTCHQERSYDNKRKP